MNPKIKEAALRLMCRDFMKGQAKAKAKAKAEAARSKKPTK